MTEKLKLTDYRDSMMSPMLQTIRFNRFDMKFMSNIHQKYISNNKPLSTSQNDLYEKLIHKYRKQIKKLGVSFKDIIDIPWKHDIVTQEQLNQQTLLKFDDNLITLQFNFNKKMIEEVREIIHDDKAEYLKRGTTSSSSFGSGTKYDFTWHNDTKIWSGPFNTYLFRGLFYFCAKHGIKIDNTVELFNQKINTSCGSKSEWEYSVHVSDSRMYINNITESMLPFVKDIDMTDQSIANVERLTKLGLTTSMHGDISHYVNSIPTTKHTLYSPADVNLLKKYIKESERKCVLYMPYHSFGSSRNEDEVRAEEIGLNDWDSYVYRYTEKENGTIGVDKLKESGYNTLITTMPVDDLIRSQKQIGTFALDADKVIYISIAGKT